MWCIPCLKIVHSWLSLRSFFAFSSATEMSPALFLVRTDLFYGQSAFPAREIYERTKWDDLPIFVDIILDGGEFENLENRDEMNKCQLFISQTFNSDWDVHVRPNARNWRQFHYALALLYQANVRARTVPVYSDCAHFSLARLRAFSPLIGQYRWANILRPQTWQR